MLKRILFSLFHIPASFLMAFYIFSVVYKGPYWLIKYILTGKETEPDVFFDGMDDIMNLPDKWINKL